MAANPAYEIRAQLYSFFKFTRTLIAKAIGREICKTYHDTQKTAALVQLQTTHQELNSLCVEFTNSTLRACSIAHTALAWSRMLARAYSKISRSHTHKHVGQQMR